MYVFLHTKSPHKYISVKFLFVFQHKSLKKSHRIGNKLHMLEGRDLQTYRARRLIKQVSLSLFHCHCFYQFYSQAMLEKFQNVTFYRSLGSTASLL